MKRFLERKLFHSFPLLYTNSNKVQSPMQVGFACGDGWFEILHDLSAKLESIISDHVDKTGTFHGTALAHDVGEKDGFLVFKMLPRDEVTSEMKALIKTAEIESSQTCEYCGFPGKRKKIRGVYQAVCDQHDKRTL